MAPAEIKNLQAMKGKPVVIRWRCPWDDWPYFRLLEIDATDATVKLQGMDAPDRSAKHDGEVFWVDLADVEHIDLGANA